MSQKTVSVTYLGRNSRAGAAIVGFGGGVRGSDPPCFTAKNCANSKNIELHDMVKTFSQNYIYHALAEKQKISSFFDQIFLADFEPLAFGTIETRGPDAGTNFFNHWPALMSLKL